MERSCSTIGCGLLYPAEVTKTFISPNLLTVSFTTLITSDSTAGSPVEYPHSIPCASSSSQRALQVSSLRPVTITFIPASPYPIHTALPRAPVAPVTKATFPFTSNKLFIKSLFIIFPPNRNFYLLQVVSIIFYKTYPILPAFYHQDI